jgi:hypothetical protein
MTAPAYIIAANLIDIGLISFSEALTFLLSSSSISMKQSFFGYKSHCKQASSQDFAHFLALQQMMQAFHLP